MEQRIKVSQSLEEQDADASGTDTGQSQLVVFPGASESELQHHTRQRARDSQHTSQRV